MTTDRATDGRQEQGPAERALSAWQEGLNALFGGFGRQTSQIAGFWGTRLDPTQLSEAVRRVSDGTREVASAQFAVAREWMQAPYWFTGVSSPSNLQASYTRLFEAYGKLISAYTETITPFQSAALQTAQRATDTTRAVIETQTKTAREVTRDMAEAQAATTQATVDAGRRATRQTARAVEQALEVAEEAAERANADTRRAVNRAEREVERREEQTGAKAPSALPVKGNVSRDGEKIYHLPGQSSYERTQADELFQTEAEAQASGYRRAETPGAGRIKGNVNRDGEKIFHVPGQANYDRIEADFLFESEEQAQAEGFRPSLR